MRGFLEVWLFVLELFGTIAGLIFVGALAIAVIAWSPWIGVPLFVLLVSLGFAAVVWKVENA